MLGKSGKKRGSATLEPPPPRRPPPNVRRFSSGSIAKQYHSRLRKMQSGALKRDYGYQRGRGGGAPESWDGRLGWGGARRLPRAVAVAAPPFVSRHNISLAGGANNGEVEGCWGGTVLWRSASAFFFFFPPMKFYSSSPSFPKTHTPLGCIATTSALISDLRLLIQPRSRNHAPLSGSRVWKLAGGRSLSARPKLPGNSRLQRFRVRLFVLLPAVDAAFLAVRPRDERDWRRRWWRRGGGRCRHCSRGFE